MTNPIRVVVTGSNRGIGKAICSLIASRQHDRPLQLFAASRKGVDLGLSAENTIYPTLDIGSRDSIRALAQQATQHGPIDVLINNAGVNLDDEYSVENAKKTLDVNYRGTLEMCQTAIPLLSPRGRIVNLSSIASSLRPFPEHIQKRFRDPNMSLDDLEILAQEYETSVQHGSEQQSGFVGPKRAYSFSKACINAFTRILARDNPGLVINACCPGWVNTDMGVLVGTSKPPKTPEQGALIPYHLAFEDIGDVSGKYWANSSLRSKEAGKVQEW
ncbi:NAD-P-binding protein [Neohortaea acidophila]|uniref:NAD-P-binding protein n=1 Tax=Neohortaea acidophila TaxID=245834 RepID=A0A6A6PQG4_9PEZI|nr:NAD-P-binding protein [Neohortaea acidophila]KAF2481683.1 NAD-P-binding protein [Neohortaea acidophila]